MKELGIYIHIPFCVKRCNYCGFYSNPIKGTIYEGQDDPCGLVSIDTNFEDAYISGVVDEIAGYGKMYGGGREVDTVYIGGGTPSLLDPGSVADIIDSVDHAFTLKKDAEISIESNPGTVGVKKLRGFRDAGVNRLSIGVQSFDDGLLKRMGRIHNAQQAEAEFRAAREVGFDNISTDLMFAVPGQTEEMWQDTLEKTFELGPEHVSFYSLQFEEGTPFYDDYRAGTLTPVDEETDRSMYHYAVEQLEKHGYEHYEISSAAKPGFRCRHNMKYWSFDEYIGVGASASSFINGTRWTERPDESLGDAPDWLAGDELYHKNSFDDNVGEYAFTALRTSRGIDKDDFRGRFGRDFWDVFSDRKKYLEEFFDAGEIREDDKYIRLTEKGIDISNRIMAAFV